MKILKRLLNKKKFWIYKQLAELEYLNTAKVERDFVNGEGFLYLGRSYRLKIVENQDVPLKLYQGYFSIRSKDLRNAKEVFKDYYRKKGLEKISDRVNHYKALIGVEPKSIRVMELKNRWASCSEDKNLNFNWKCIMAPMTIIDYIVAHELAHLIYPHHTDEFWNIVDKMLPDYLERKTWLRENGAGLDL